ncbi:double-strand break repair helicase AddA [Pararhodobacter sp. SW119]|uniref:double-strand break repair helicase AddA n=1 Tax=Pararhodobacter sp. SW119 TaxID=2780075 RepID=UPI001AE09A6B|nr:double-strand break repair helicase AddA [Pararhodobacter sp. SW119]
MDEATRRQIRAAEPSATTWLSANAGSGKTRVLIDRVARLLLRGVAPQRILCLTYTKAAAAEMQNRLFARLGDWAMKDDADLSAALHDLGETVIDPDLLARARRLFARALETPGGLKIQTIHAFCAALLRRFPLEAGVAPDFAEADPRSLLALRMELLDDLAAGDEAPRLQALAARIGEGTLLSLLTELSRFRDAFRPNAPAADLNALFDLPPGFDDAALAAQVFAGDEVEMARVLLPHLRAGKPTDLKLADALSPLIHRVALDDLPRLEGALLFGKSAKEAFTAKGARLPTKDLRAKLERAEPVALAALDALGDRIEAARALRQRLEAFERATALHGFARDWMRAAEAAKAERGWLEFDDLIVRARDLLGDPSVAQWVLYKLDGGIDHILIDEAQDTSPEQWQVIGHLAQEFTAGQGAREAVRTIFVVGDRKQSIYSFQGADLRGFDRMQGEFDARFAAVGPGMQRLELTHSFRSSEAILRLVDTCFAPDPQENGLGGGVAHLAFQTELPGRVDLWPMVEPAEKPAPGDWDVPLDRPSEEHHELTLARQIAREIAAILACGERIATKDGWRTVGPGDFLVLVRRRRLLFHEIIRALKAEGLPVAGADRLVLTEELAAQDLIALLRFLALPEDDLSLACALRSPLFGWSEDRLFRLAHGRGKQFLWERLRAAAGAEETVAVLQDLRDQTDFLRPYELIERVLTRHEGRRRLLSRFGIEVEDALEAFVAQALVYEIEEIPTLDGFLGWLTAADVEVKRQSEAAGGRIRVMTVHGAKGLEAPVVVLPDTADRRDPERAALRDVAGQPILRLPAEDAPEVQIVADEAARARRREESDRLLYVALTRAERWLIIAGAGKAADQAGWYARIKAGMEALNAEAQDFPPGPGSRFESGAWPAPAPAPRVVAQVTDDTDLDHLSRPLPVPATRTLAISPSALGGAKALPGEAGATEEEALKRGRMMHLLLEHLPAAAPGDRPARAEALLAPFDAPPVEVARCRDEAEALMNNDTLRPVFAQDTLAEVALSGLWHDRLIWGVIDRLQITADHVLAIDFKTNRVVPATPAEVPEGLLRQLGAYVHLLRPLYPDRRIEAAILWTATAKLMRLDNAALAAALDRAALDPEVAAS